MLYLCFIMQAQYSFIKPSVELALAGLPALLPALEKAFAIYMDAESGELCMKAVLPEQGSPAVCDYSFGPYKVACEQMRQSATAISWVAKDDLPFETHSQKRIQSVFSELENNILALRFPSAADAFSDLFLLYFRSNHQQFGPSARTSEFSTSDKAITAQLMYRIIRQQLEEINQNGQVLKVLNAHMRDVVSENERLKRELEETRNHYGESLENLCTRILNDLTAHEVQNYGFSKAAIARIKSFKGDITLLRGYIDQAVTIASTLAFGQPGQHVLIEASYLKMGPKPKVKSDSAAVVNIKLTRTVQLLDKLETAARLVMNQNLPLTSARVGAQCPQPISAPAITDALKKHRERILQLMHREPEKWAILRAHFRPLKNLLVNDSEDQSKSA